MRRALLAAAFCAATAGALVAGQAPQAPVASPSPAASPSPSASPSPDMNAYYTLGPDSLPREGVPKGELRGPFVLPNSPAYPGTQHSYWVHVPAQYDPALPASLMVSRTARPSSR